MGILSLAPRAVGVDVDPPAQHVLAVERKRRQPQDLVDRSGRRVEAMDDLVRNPDPHDWIRAASLQLKRYWSEIVFERRALSSMNSVMNSCSPPWKISVMLERSSLAYIARA